MRTIFYLAVIPGLMAFLMVLLVRERRAAPNTQSSSDLRLRSLPRAYWRYLLVTAIFGLGNSSNAFLILRTQDAGASVDTSILIYAAYNLVAALDEVFCWPRLSFSWSLTLALPSRAA